MFIRLIRQQYKGETGDTGSEKDEEKQKEWEGQTDMQVVRYTKGIHRFIET